MKNKYLLSGLIILVLSLGLLYWWSSYNQLNNQSSVIEIKNIPEQTFYSDKIYSTLTPKTNSWMSSAFFKKDSEPLFVYPYSIDFTDTGFTANIPQITSVENSIFGSHNANISFSFGDNLETHVVEYGDIDATFELRDNDQNAIARIRTIRGVPYIYITSLRNNNITIKAPTIKLDNNIVQLDNSFRLYNIATPTLQESTTLLSKLTQDQTLVLGAIPKTNDSDIIDLYANTIISTITIKKIVNNSNVETAYIFDTVDNKPVLFGQLNNKTPINTNIESVNVSYNSIKGDIVTYLGKEFIFQDTLFNPITTIDTTLYTEEEKNIIRSALLDDLSATNFKEDTYYGGKTMARQAYLYEIAKSFGWDDITVAIITPLKQELITWLSDSDDGKKFVYEPNLKTLIGIPSSFGSELANDHHFHYGYIVYAASVVAEYDKEFFTTYKDKISLILEDYASLNTNSSVFPYLRVFDTYELHSWASGFALFQDGNNQESTSEAINSWYAMYRWALLTNDKYKQNISKWLYSQEINSAKDLWLNPKDIISGTAYQAPIVSIVWGGKIDYATWFSNTDEAKLAIQLLPLNFATEYLKQDTDLIKTHIDYIKSQSSIDEYTEFKDILLTYESTINPEVISKIQNINSNNFDDGNSKTASLVWAFQFN